MARIRLLLSAAVVCLSAGFANAADLCGYPWPAGGLLGSRGFGVSGSLYGLGYIPIPPYYALHPPVYYSHPVPRTYGHSPFPYPGTFRTPEVVVSQPEEIINPHLEEAPDSDEPPVPPTTQASGRVARHTKKTSASPRWKAIANPFVSEAPSVAQWPAQ